MVLTAQGLDALKDAAPVHVELVRHHFIDRLAPADLAALERIAGRLEPRPAEDDTGERPRSST